MVVVKSSNYWESNNGFTSYSLPMDERSVSEVLEEYIKYLEEGKSYG